MRVLSLRVGPAATQVVLVDFAVVAWVLAINDLKLRWSVRPIACRSIICWVLLLHGGGGAGEAGDEVLVEASRG